MRLSRLVVFILQKIVPFLSLSLSLSLPLSSDGALSFVAAAMCFNWVNSVEPNFPKTNMYAFLCVDRVVSRVGSLNGPVTNSDKRRFACLC